MMRLFSRKSPGVSISSTGIFCAQASGKPASPRLERVSSCPLLAGCIRFSLMEPNILNVQGFVEALKEARNLLLYRGTRVSLALPDAAGRVLLLETEGRFRSRAEGLDILRWKLKKRMPIDSGDIHLDYQEVATRSSGETLLLVALMARPVIRQYEELLYAAELEPVRIEFNLFSIMRMFERKLSSQASYGLITYYDMNLGVLFFCGGKLEFIRVRDLAGSLSVDERVHNDIKCSVLSFRGSHPDVELQDIFFSAPAAVLAELRDVIRDTTGIEPSPLETRSEIAIMENVPSDQASLFHYVPAIGAALRDL